MRILKSCTVIWGGGRQRILSQMLIKKFPHQHTFSTSCHCILKYHRMFQIIIFFLHIYHNSEYLFLMSSVDTRSQIFQLKMFSKQNIKIVWWFWHHWANSSAWSTFLILTYDSQRGWGRKSFFLIFLLGNPRSWTGKSMWEEGRQPLMTSMRENALRLLRITCPSEW